MTAAVLALTPARAAGGVDEHLAAFAWAALYVEQALTTRGAA